MNDPEPPLPQDVRYAGFWVRAAARIVDILFLIAAFNLFYLGDRLGADAGWWAPSGIPEDVPDLGTEHFSYANVLRGVFFLGFPIFYYTYLHGAYGQTFGKMAFRIKVLSADGGPLSYRKAFYRWLGYLLCDVTLNLGYVWAAFDPRKQGLHDKACKTIVVHAQECACAAPAVEDPERQGSGA